MAEECYICGGPCRFGKPVKKDEGNPLRTVTVSGEDPHVAPDWKGNCSICGESPIVPSTGLCGPCTFGEAETAGGNW